MILLPYTPEATKDGKKTLCSSPGARNNRYYVKAENIFMVRVIYTGAFTCTLDILFIDLEQFTNF